MSSVCVPGARRKLVACATLSVLAFLLGLPALTVLALTLLGLGVPLAVVLAGGRLRDLLPPRPADRRDMASVTSRNKGNAL